MLENELHKNRVRSVTEPDKSWDNCHVLCPQLQNPERKDGKSTNCVQSEIGTISGTLIRFLGPSVAFNESILEIDSGSWPNWRNNWEIGNGIALILV
jgi:hypothetical protein